jgi:SpoVK/Ycf46/Vps4 family AAA+-type ATPase
MNPLGLQDREAGLVSALDGSGLAHGLTSPATAEPRDLALAAGDLSGHLALAGSTPDADSRRVFLAAVDRRTQGSVPSGGHLTRPRRSWDSLVLTDDRTALLREAVDRAEIQAEWEAQGARPDARPGDSGLRLLFHGPPGTGKTLAAEVMAHTLGRDVLGVNLARLVSKWIGETEKNLETVFDAAERGDLLLFFDEADAVFAKRSEVADARDRYANLETAYLLGRIETFDGVVVLSTNLRRNIDSAFARRLEFIVPFDLPDPEARQRLWELHTPSWVDLAGDVDLAELAALYDLSGALIRNAMTAASFLSAAGRVADPGPTGPPVVGTHHLVRAIEREHAKAGLAFPGPPHRLRLAGAAAGGSTHKQGRQR